jgi:transcriptional regulator with PAS, ATPase and Fis domain
MTDVANTTQSERLGRKKRPARAVSNHAPEREAMLATNNSTNKKMARGSWAPPRLQVPAPNHHRRHHETVRRFGSLSARSTPMIEVFDVVERFAQTDVTVTLFGETGAGKDVIARAMHEESARAGGPFVVFDCGAVAANLVESELLGHERGAFTGAVSAHAGAFERASGGTLFLDEVGELPLDLQPRLLRALESRKVRRVGGKTERRIDVRVIAASNRDLRADVSNGKFREDLFFRLAVAVVSVPPLRDRMDDLPELVHSLLGDLGHGDLGVADATLASLRAHPWPGNVRELKNVLSCAVAFVDRGAKALEPCHLRILSPANDDESWLDGLPLGGQALERIERVAIRQTMAQAAGNKTYAARALGIAVSTLYEKLKKYGL